MTTRRQQLVCPTCGNRDFRQMEDNDESSRSLDWVVRCKKRVKVEESSYTELPAECLPGWRPGDGLVECGMEWMPNDPPDDYEPDWMTVTEELRDEASNPL